MILPLLRLAGTVAIAAGAVLLLKKLAAKPKCEEPLAPTHQPPEAQ